MNATLILRDGFRLRDKTATALVVTMTGEGLTKTIATTAALGQAGQQVELIFAPIKSGRISSWAHLRGSKSFNKAAPKGGWTSRGVVDFDHNGKGAGAAVVLTAAAAAMLAPFANAEQLDLIVTRETLEIHTPRIGAKAVWELSKNA